MKSYNKETIQGATDEALASWLTVLNGKIAKGNIKWINSKKEEIACPWKHFNGSGLIVVNREQDMAGWDLARRVQIRCEAERQNAGNQIASFKVVLQAKPDTLSATVRSTGMKRANCPVCDQLAEAQSVIGNAAKVARELFDRAEAARLNDEIAADKAEMKAIEDEKRAVAAELKAKQDEAKAAKAKAEKAVKDAFKQTQPVPEGNGEPVTAGV